MSYNIPDTVIPGDDAHGSVLHAKLTNALYEHVEEPEASPIIPSRTARTGQLAQLSKRLAWYPQVLGSNPTFPRRTLRAI